jgi:hypothetical protein
VFCTAEVVLRGGGCRSFCGGIRAGFGCRIWRGRSGFGWRIRGLLRGGLFGCGLFFATLQLDDFGAQIAFFGEVAPVYDFKGFLFFVFRHGVSLGLLG